MTNHILVAAAICFFGGIGGKGKSLTFVTGTDAAKINKITVQTDWGKDTTITSKQEIAEIISTLCGCTYKKINSQPPYTDNLYDMRFFSGSKDEVTFLLSGKPIINNLNYTIIGSIDTQKLEKIVGLYPPS